MGLTIKNIILAILMMILFCFNVLADEQRSTFQADVRSRRIAAGTIIDIRFLDSLSTLTSYPGNSFNACIEEDIKLNKKTAIPAGTLMRGTVYSVKKSRRLKVPASLYLDFDHLVTPDGRQLDVSLKLTDLTPTKDGMGISGGGSYRLSVKDNFSDSVDFVQNSVAWGNEIGDKVFNGYPKIITTPLAATGGFMASTVVFTGKSIADLFRRGNEVVIPQNQVLRGTLTEPVDIPTY